MAKRKVEIMFAGDVEKEARPGALEVDRSCSTMV